MIDVQHYEKLPDFMTKQELKQEISALLKTECSVGDLSQLEALFELSIRKENSELELDNFSKERIDRIVHNSWNKDSLSNTELIIMVIFNFELKKSFDLLKKYYPSITNDEVKSELDECFEDAKNSPPSIKYW